MNQTAITRTRSAATTRSNRSGFVLIDFLWNIVTTLDACRQRHKARMQVTQIDQRILRDIGISGAQRFILLEI